jgi:hypothetical protein
MDRSIEISIFLKKRMSQEHLKVSLRYVFVMLLLGLLIVEICILINDLFEFFQLMQLKYPFLIGFLHIKIKSLDCPVSIVL